MRASTWTRRHHRFCSSHHQTFLDFWMQNYFLLYFLLFFRRECWSVLRWITVSRKSRSVPCQNDIDGLSHFGFKSCIFFFVTVHKECNLCLNVNCVAVSLNTFGAFPLSSKGNPSQLSRSFQEEEKRLCVTQSLFPLFLPYSRVF